MKGFLHKCLLLSLSFVVSLTGLSVLFSTDANAISYADDWISKNTTSELINKIDNYYGMSCDTGDYATRWLQAFQTNKFYNQNNGKWENAVASYNAAVAGNGAWYVAYDQKNNGDNTSNPYFINIYWVDNKDQWSFKFTEPSGGAPGQMAIVRNQGVGDFVKLHMATIGSTNLIQGAQGDCEPEYLWGGVDYDSNGTGWQVDENGNAISKMFVNTFTTVYPPGYEGDEVPSTVGGIKSVPDFTYQVTEKYKLTALYNRNLEINETVSKWNYKTFSANDDWTEKDQLDTKTLPIIQTYDYTLPGKGKYLLKININVAPPGAPRTDIKELTFKIDANGTYQFGSTLKDDCTNGVCEPPSPYEDCSTYGIDLIGGFGCIIGNFQKWLFITLNNLFVPSSSFMTEFWSSLTGFLNEKLGFIYQSVATLISLLTGMIANATTTDCTYTPGGTFFGAPLNLNFCSFEQSFPVAWNTMTAIVRSITVLALVFAFQRKYHEIMEAR